MKRKILALLALAALLSSNAMAVNSDVLIFDPNATVPAAEATQAPEETPAAEVQAADPAEETPAPEAEPSVQPEASAEAPIDGEAEVQDEPAGFLQKYLPAITAGAAAILTGTIALAVGRSKAQKAARELSKAKAEAARLAQPATDTGAAEKTQSEKISIKAVGNVHNIGCRKYQQDAFGVSSLSNHALVDRKGVLAIVADGMGGLENSGEISRAMVRGALEDFPRMPDDQRKGLLTLLASANRKVDEKFSGLGRMGTTLVAVNIKNNRMDYISVGDSRISLLRGGSMITLNRAHNYAAQLQAAAAVGDGNIANTDQDPRGAALTSYLGMRSLNKVDIPTESIRLLPGDMIILMTDGIFGTLDENTIAKALKNGAVEGAARLEEAILAKKKPNQDNFTAIILEV